MWIVEDNESHFNSQNISIKYTVGTVYVLILLPDFVTGILFLSKKQIILFVCSMNFIIPNNLFFLRHKFVYNCRSINYHFKNVNRILPRYLHVIYSLICGYHNANLFTQNVKVYITSYSSQIIIIILLNRKRERQKKTYCQTTHCGSAL